MKHNINTLPVPTWNHLGVNRAGQEFMLPQVPTEGFAEGTFSLIDLPSIVTKESNFPITEKRLESGIGRDFDDYIQKNANVACFLKASQKTEQLIRLKSVVTAKQPVVAGDYGIYAEEGASLTIMQETTAEKDTKGFSAELTRIFAGKDAFVRLIQIQNLNRNCSSWSGVAIHAEDGAHVEVIRAVLGGEKAALGTKAQLEGRESSYTLNTIYFGDKTQIFDFNDTAEHRGRYTQCDMYTAGVLAGESSKILRGTIDFKRGAVFAAGHESEEVLLFGKKARNRTVPLILCGEEQVEGQHAATIGRLDEQQIYYLCSRGLSAAQARMLLVEGRFSPVLDKIPDKILKEELTAQIERRLKDNEPQSIHS